MYHLLITVALLFTSSLADHHHHHHEHHHHDRDNDREKDLRALCEDNSDSRQCWEIIKSTYDRFNTDDVGIVATAIDLARGKASDFHNLCSQLHDDSNDDKLKEKYDSCSRNYDDATRELDDARGNLDPNVDDNNNFDSLLEKVGEVGDELQKCRDQFDNSEDVFDPAHVGDRNREFGVYLDIVRVASDRLADRNNDNNNQQG